MQAHYDGRRFFNPSDANAPPVWMVPRLLFTRRARWPRSIADPPRRPPDAPSRNGAVTVTFVGHATFLIQSGEATILTDPVYSLRASPVPFAGPRRVRPPGVAFRDLPEISIVLLSHNHYDHCDLRTLRALERRFRPRVITPLGHRKLLRSGGVTRVEELDWWDSADRGAPATITLTPAQHFSARGIFDRNRALWGGFAVSVGGRRIFFAGDSGYGPHFRAIGKQLGPFDLALLPIGAYEPRWFMRNIHMNPAEAVQTHLDVGARLSLGMHFGTFQLTPEAIDAPVTALAAARDASGVAATQFVTLETGASVVLE